MKSELYAKLKLQWEPVAISFTDVRPKQAEQFERGQQRLCGIYACSCQHLKEL